MKVLLVIPPSPFLADAKVMASLGVLWVAAALRAKHHEVQVLDLEGRRDWRDLTASAVEENRPQAVGVTGTSAHWPFCVEINRIVKQADPAIKTIAGGAHVSMGPELAKTAGFDVLVMDDGLSGICLALEAAPGSIVKGPMTPTEIWPLPARDLIAIKDYKYFLAGDENKLATIMMATMGCPYQCFFCGGREVEFYRRYRTRPVEQVISELEHCEQEYGFKNFVFMDDEVNINKAWLVDLCAALVARGTPWGWRAFVKSNLFTDEQAAQMKAAGCIEVCTGVESGSDRILKTWIRKSTTYAINKQCVEIARRNGLRIKCFCMIGNPGETLEDVHKTKEWILDARPDSFDLTVFTPYPGSPIFNKLFHGLGRAEIPTNNMENMPLEATLPNFEKESWFYKGVRGEYKTGTRTLGMNGEPGLSSAELVALRDQIDEECKEALGHGDQASNRISPLFTAQQVYEAGMGQTPVHKLAGP